METPSLRITREKHLDHLVRVVPFIVLAYGIHSYIMLQMKAPLGADMLMFMGLALVLMISGLVAYDLNHKVFLFEDRIEMHFLGQKQVIAFREIVNVHLVHPEDNFGNVFIRGHHQKARLYFVDDGAKIKQWIEERRNLEELAA